MSIALKYNFERKYILNKHINSDKERVYGTGELKLLFAETNGRCADCKEPLKWNLDNDIDSTKNQIAHIYGKKLFEKAGMPLFEKYHIKSEEEINQYNNLIILCESCHRNYDKVPTYEKYVKILKYKEEIANRVSDKIYIYFALEDVLKKIKNGAFDKIADVENNIEIYEKIKLVDKLKYNKINNIKSTNIVNEVMIYFKNIKNIFDEMEDEKESLGKYKDVYSKLKKAYNDKNDILNIINNTLMESSVGIFIDIVPIITSYMIMSCEVLDNDTK